MSNRQSRVIPVVFLTIISLLFLRVGKYGLEGRSIAGDYVAVKRVNDGDTITARINGRMEKIRLIGIDAPELGQEPWGQMAEGRLKAIMASSAWKVRVEYDVEKRDKYGRLLAYLWTQDGEMANAGMLSGGYAVLFTFPPNVKHVEELRAAEKKARSQKLVIWGGQGLRQLPVDYRREHPRLQ